MQTTTKIHGMINKKTESHSINTAEKN